MRIVILIFCVLVVAVCVALVGASPRLDRNWDADVKVLASVTIAPDGLSITLNNIRNWRYNADGPSSTDYFDATYLIDDLRGMSLYEQRLDSRGLIAHTFVVFDFGSSYAIPRIGVSVETRREVGEQYSLIKGAVRGFELTHIWASEIDLVERRVKYLRYSLTRYHVAQALSHQKRYLVAFLEQTAALEFAPRWYNTFTSNCTNVIVNTANLIKPGFLPFDKSFVFTGLADDYLISRGVLSRHGATIIDASNIDRFVELSSPGSGAGPTRQQVEDLNIDHDAKAKIRRSRY